MVDGGPCHGDGRHAADKDAANAGAEQNALGYHGAGCEDGKLIPTVLTQSTISLGGSPRLNAKPMRAMDGSPL
jgi:hypothetical protein